MTGFSPDWLALREPHDLAARNSNVLHAVTAHFGQRNGLSITDLGCGTGSTWRALAPALAAGQQWRMIDNDPVLLARIGQHAGIAPVQCDLAANLETALNDAPALVVTSALLDLVSDAWLEQLVALVVMQRSAFYAALSYDGRTTFSPADDVDEEIVAAVNEHQRRDKGFGPALGPDGATKAIERFRRAGYSVIEGPSDWMFETDHREIQLTCLNGWATAAGETGRMSSVAVSGWLQRRLSLVDGGHSRISVGHVDFFATPIGER